ncbi:MAG: hypothetical protein ACLPN6_14150 [Streptosporangiaceae bacterium]
MASDQDVSAGPARPEVPARRDMPGLRRAALLLIAGLAGLSYG